MTIYGPDATNQPCSATIDTGKQFAELATCYNSTWKYYSIDGCTNPSLLSTTVTSATATAIAQSKPHLAPGAIAGAAIGSVIGAAVLLTAVLYMLWRWRRRPGRLESLPNINISEPLMMEKDSNPAAHELASRDAPAELFSGTDVAHELAAPRGIEVGH